jgi:formate hydrogenlyase transcriptional activator
MVENRDCCSDLYDPLNVFPVRIPPLRKRPGDIAHLGRYFTQKYGRRIQKQIELIPAVAMSGSELYACILGRHSTPSKQFI